MCGAAATDHGGLGGLGSQPGAGTRASTHQWPIMADGAVRRGCGAGAVVRGVARTGERRSCRSPCPSPTACLRTWRKRYGPASRTPRPTEVQANGRNRTAYKRTTRSPADSRVSRRCRPRPAAVGFAREEQSCVRNSQWCVQMHPPHCAYCGIITAPAIGATCGGSSEALLLRTSMSFCASKQTNKQTKRTIRCGAAVCHGRLRRWRRGCGAPALSNE